MSSEAGEAAALSQAASDTTETFSTHSRFAVRRSFTLFSHTSVMLDAKSTVFLAILKLRGQKLPLFKGTRETTHNH